MKDIFNVKGFMFIPNEISSINNPSFDLEATITCNMNDLRDLVPCANHDNLKRFFESRLNSDYCEVPTRTYEQKPYQVYINGKNITEYKLIGVDLARKEQPKIKSINSNSHKKIVTVVFDNDNVQMAKCHKEDLFDESMGVALCIAYEQFGSKTKFHKFVKENAKQVGKENKPKKKVKKENN